MNCLFMTSCDFDAQINYFDLVLFIFNIFVLPSCFILFLCHKDKNVPLPKNILIQPFYFPGQEPIQGVYSQLSNTNKTSNQKKRTSKSAKPLNPKNSNVIIKCNICKLEFTFNKTSI